MAFVYGFTESDTRKLQPVRFLHRLQSIAAQGKTEFAAMQRELAAAEKREVISAVRQKLIVYKADENSPDTFSRLTHLFGAFDLFYIANVDAGTLINRSKEFSSLGILREDALGSDLTLETADEFYQFQ